MTLADLIEIAQTGTSAPERAADAAMAAYIHRASLAHDKTNRSA